MAHSSHTITRAEPVQRSMIQKSSKNSNCKPADWLVRIGHVARSLFLHNDNKNKNESIRHKIPCAATYLDPFRKDSTALRHLQWLLQKDNLGQDALLVGYGGGAGAVQRRRLAWAYAALAQRPVEWLTLSPDTTEADLKQRRVLVSNNNSSNSNTTIRFQDQAPVRAALQGHLLILDGLERAERNVLPTLNNLLENRELPLEDGRLLVSQQRYQQLLLTLKQSDSSCTASSASTSPSSPSSVLVPVHPDFRCLALFSVSSRHSSRNNSNTWKQNRLDPPVRSRFQIRRVDPPTSEQLFQDLLQTYHTTRNETSSTGSTLNDETDTLAKQLTMFATSMQEQLFPITTTALAGIARGHTLFPHQPLGDWLQRAVSPWNHSDNDALERVCRELHIPLTSKSSSTQSFTTKAGYQLERVQTIPDDPHRLLLHFQSFNTNQPQLAPQSSTVTVTVPSGGHVDEPVQNNDKNNNNNKHDNSWVATRGSQQTLTAMLQEHAVGRDLLLLSPKGQGKSRLARHFAQLLHYQLHLFPLYKEMTATDLLLRRTSSSPNTGTTHHPSDEKHWTESPLLTAARTGQICVLDGIDKLAPGTLATLQSLLTDRAVELPDGTHYSVANGTIHPSFRVIALASSSSAIQARPKQYSMAWLDDTVTSMFTILPLPEPTRDCLRDILHPHIPAHRSEQDDPMSSSSSSLLLEQILNVHEQLLDKAQDCGVQPLSIRTLLRLVQHTVAANNNNNMRNDSNFAATISWRLYDNICATLLAELLPPTQRAALESLLGFCGIHGRSLPNSPTKKQRHENNNYNNDRDWTVQIDHNTNRLSIGNDFTMTRRVASKPELVPSPYFLDIPAHVKMIQTLLREWSVGRERAFLLLGNQGTGKNKICDRICELANFEREYIQLHRDSTIGQLTLSPSVEDGRIVWKDSPLVRAVTQGRALVIDEADKAPLEVVAVLKSLVEDGQLLLADGRRILRNGANDDNGDITIHPDFTVWVLANRPGRLFHGNDFFNEIGDCFSAHVIPNPDLESEISLLQAYAPSVDVQILRRIAASFDELRSMFQHGDIAYPYSTREAVAIAKHLEAYPDDDVIDVLQNVLSLDSFDDHLFAALGTVFRNHGFDFPTYKAWVKSLQASPGSGDLQIEYRTDRSSEGTSTSPPPLSGPKIGKWDEKNEAHVGGNQWQGGTGGSDTAGMGGRGGPYRLDRGHKVHQVSDEAKAEVSEEAKAAARRIAQQALSDRLREIGMSGEEYETYNTFLESIKGDIANLRATLETVEFKTTERDWIKRQTDGELDDSRLVEGIAGEKNVYKRRGVVAPTYSSGPPRRQKRLRFVVDCSGSMYRFNGYDNRLNRCLQAAALVMESLDGMDDKFDYSIVGHSGDSRCINLVDFGDPPKNSKERLRVLQTIVAHTQFTQSGDNTLGAIKQAIADVSSLGSSFGDNNDDVDVNSIVIAISDANLERYGISPRELARAMHPPSSAAGSTKAFCIFIASFGDEAEDIKRALPLGRGFVCMDSGDLPGIVRNILTSEME